MFTSSCFTLSREEEIFLLLDSKSAVDYLMSVSKSKGLKNSDLVSLTGWSAPKVSKIAKYNQKLSPEDLKVWAKVLGYRPDLFLGEQKDLRNYNMSKDLRSVKALLKEAVTRKGSAADVSLVTDAVCYELPLSIVNTLKLEPTDYVTKGKIEKVPDPFEEDDKEYSDDGIFISIYQRNIVFEDYDVCIKYLISPDREKIILGLFEVSRTGQAFPRKIRTDDKCLLNIDEKLNKEFEKYARSNQDWLKNAYLNGEIYSVLYDADNLPSKEEIEKDLITVYDYYCDLIYAKKGVDIKGRQHESLTADANYYEFGRVGFPVDTIKKSRTASKYCCENDQSHTSFEGEDGNQYMVPIPLIPLNNTEQFGEGLTSIGNCLCLCPNCSVQFYHGTKSDRRQMVFKLFEKHEKELKNNGVNIELGQVMQLNSL